MKAAFILSRVSPTRVGVLAALAFAPCILQAHNLQICKASDPSHPVSGSFTFQVSISSTTTKPYNFSPYNFSLNGNTGSSISVLVGACSAEIPGDGYGPYQITEILQTNIAVTNIKSKIVYGSTPNPGGSGLLDSNYAQGSAIVYANDGGTTVVTFTNSNVSPNKQGCTPGFYKQPKHSGSWTGFTTDEVVSKVFTGVDLSLSGETLLDALQGGGGPGLVGAEEILLRAAVAALLNASSADVSYPLTADTIEFAVNAALATKNRDAILTLATALDNYNNGPGGCPLS